MKWGYDGGYFLWVANSFLFGGIAFDLPSGQHVEEVSC